MNQEHQQPNIIRVCHGKKCRHAAPQLMAAAEKKLQESGQKMKFQIEQCGCLGHCNKGPNIQIAANNTRKTITGVSPRKIAEEIDYASGKKQPPRSLPSAKKSLNDLLQGGF